MELSEIMAHTDTGSGRTEIRRHGENITVSFKAEHDGLYLILQRNT